MAAVPQFGTPEPGQDTPDRPAAFAVILRHDVLAVMRVDSRRRGRVYDLPGGGIDPGESPAEAAVRECGEEAGLEVAVDAEPFALADQFFVNDDGWAHNSRGRFLEGRVIADAPALKVEDDHTLVWMPPERALVVLDREAHAWAVAAFLRRLERARPNG
ncbi:NUDIX domain-containing protein [Phenylobacterium sp. J367]|uniref:NUDIX domain-containing protein n=1 Tax=Phenylobacterium sp. J367 TaxID=2898435 RepID=UPI002151A1AD|nr:NUDIX domain-containing protein [Phenylobacterium sp. J367]MCR5879791.1 NUDIX domain-containing protein [Phenylobacterium sp. J367]